MSTSPPEGTPGRCAYCGQPSRRLVQAEPGDPASPLLGAEHDACFDWHADATMAREAGRW
ncbi:hypothetical protein GXW83_25610 [Streptacidiphilus sp. PB12-B1b]|uniref:hypothetical protein n=1 Tax=Streptacidiphilus sp. PB12-B1b TaxID=2705012 RepID=UPI0015FB47DC|nr:hypothetical protein [Streptacidiphilus sp. PB12-B1b]QMU78581.1 hypothetical protein GXW83_25610 [Streptacidiphilus sp. PB12-B1b]